ncbi:hypothetical protein C5167_012239 [Papaver somniferum]|uniref:Myb/SANT-like DNA-binding domain-containing protein n=1 Tax=Papaver somniferum TaxID=3469 RepID=A0A4Y7IYX0_PAPSO|nr:trihelix transcription factor ASIL2-like [Papaver somniferum]RZC53386.1 hypothetical protein C5167_012239 [Papaver somniferum]
MENQKVQGVAHTTATTTTNSRAFHHYNGSAYGGREDCWTEGATAVLIEAWGNRYLELNRGNLRQKDWKEVADSVNVYHIKQGIKNFSRTDIQCKNRIDTIKKKYKSVKSKPNPSQWPFFDRLHSLIGANFSPVNKKLASSSSSPQPIHYRHPGSGGGLKNPNPNLGMYSGGGMSKKARLDDGEYSDSSEGEDEDGYDDSEGEGEGEGREEEVEVEAEELERGGGRKRRGGGEDGGGVGEGYRELAKEVVKFGKMYERIECSKQQQMMELEKQRMEFTKEIEFQRMQMFMDAQLKVEKRKRPNHGGESLGFDPLLFFSLSSFQF